MSGEASPPRRILLLGGEHYHRSVGDVAMLSVAVDQLRLAFPSAELLVATASAVRLGQFVAGVKPAVLEGGVRGRFGRVEYAAGRILPEALLAFAFTLATRGRVIVRRVVRFGRPETPGPVTGPGLDAAPDPGQGVGGQALDRHIAGVDLLVVYGGGYLADADRDKALMALGAMRRATALGIPYVLTGQGIGPVDDPVLLAAARQELPRASAIGTREQRLSAMTLTACDVPSERICFTGDDALLLLEQGRRPEARELVGLSYRTAVYLGLTVDNVRTVHDSVRAWLADRDPQWLPIVTSTYGDEDLAGVRQVVSAHDAQLSATRPDPSDVIDAIRHCSLVVSSTYHAALFAAGAGIPTLAFGGTDYGLAKLHGIREALGPICAVLDVRAGVSPAAVANALDAVHEPAHRARAQDECANLQGRVRTFYADLPDVLQDRIRN